MFDTTDVNFEVELEAPPADASADNDDEWLGEDAAIAENPEQPDEQQAPPPEPDGDQDHAGTEETPATVFEDQDLSDPLPTVITHRRALNYRDVLIDDALGADAIASNDEQDSPAQDDDSEPVDAPPADDDDVFEDVIAPMSPSSSFDPQDQRDHDELMHYLRPGLTAGQKLLGSVVALALIALLAGQAIHHWRATLVLHEDYGAQVRSLYKTLNIPVHPAVSHRDYEVVRHTVVPREDEPEVLQLRATVTNRSISQKPPPSVRVTFFDRFGDEQLVRTFAPEQYAARNAPPSLIRSGDRVEVALDLVNVDPDAATNYLVEACATLADNRVSCADSATGRRNPR